MVKEFQINDAVVLRIITQLAPRYEVIKNGKVVWRSAALIAAADA